jgi:hypothetical protein
MGVAGRQGMSVRPRPLGHAGPPAESEGAGRVDSVGGGIVYVCARIFKLARRLAGFRAISESVGPVGRVHDPRELVRIKKPSLSETSFQRATRVPPARPLTLPSQAQFGSPCPRALSESDSEFSFLAPVVYRPDGRATWPQSNRPVVTVRSTPSATQPSDWTTTSARTGDHLWAEAYHEAGLDPADSVAR